MAIKRMATTTNARFIGPLPLIHPNVDISNRSITSCQTAEEELLAHAGEGVKVSNPCRMGRIWKVFVAAMTAGVLGVMAMPASGATGSLAAVIDYEAEDCTQIPPEETPPLALSTDKVLPLEVRVLAEASDLTIAKGYMKTAKETFARIGIDVKLRYQKVAAPAEWSAGSGLIDGPNQSVILEFMKALFSGQRPKGTDVVYFMTRHWDGGFADCIGGIRFAERAFAFGSIDYAAEGVVPSPTVNEGVIAAHEIGHLLGAQHHYANCIEAQPSGALRGDTNPCTTMWPAAANASSTFGLLERSFIRSYATEHAKG